MLKRVEELEARARELEAKQQQGAAGQADDAERLPNGTPRMQIEGYADVNLRASNERGRTTSFGLGQIDLFITSRLSENFSVLGELILEAEQDDSFTFSAHRLLLRYAPRDYFTLGVWRDRRPTALSKRGGASTILCPVCTSQHRSRARPN